VTDRLSAVKALTIAIEANRVRRGDQVDALDPGEVLATLNADRWELMHVPDGGAAYVLEPGYTSLTYRSSGDGEVDAITQIDELLARLGPATAGRRVLRYLTDRYSEQVPS